MHAPPVHVACLCAAWCRTCDDYAPVLRQVVAELAAAGSPVRAHWIDIEDEAELVGDFEVETFPTLLVIDAQAVRFAGPLTPQADTLRRVLRATLADSAAAAPSATMHPGIEAFAQRLRQRHAAAGEA